MGRGNQITERGLLLRHLVDVERATAFLAGEVAAWNPFRISLNERLFLLYHLAEIDGVIFELVNDLGSLPAGTVLETNEAARMTCKALLRVLSRAKNEVQPRDVLRFRIACDLANTIAAELGMADEAQSLIGSQVRKRPKPVKRVKRKGSVGATPRKTTKNADHQTVPRFEQLVDLGFLTKPGADAPSEEERLASRKRWKYVPTEICHRWHRAMRGKVLDRSSFLWNGFSAACFEAFEIAAKDDATGNERTIAEYVWRSYRSIERRAGMNPVESIALFAMLLAAIDGVRIELSDVHRLMIRIKRDDLMPDHVFFASGNELDHMFVHIKPGFVERFDGAQP
jgi:hypothetical protein